MLDEKIKIYISELLDDNKRLFAFNSHINEKRKELKSDLLKLCDGFGSDDDFKRCGALIGRLIGMAMIVRQNNKDIRKNLLVIEGLRNGTIKEI